MNTTTSFGHWMRERRKQRRLSQKALGHLLGYAEITIRKIEGDAYPLTTLAVEQVINELAMAHDDREALLQFAHTQSAKRRVKGSFTSSTLPFFGRANELGELRARLRDPQTRCISILGIGGIGKTWLAIQAMDLFRHETEQEGHLINLTKITAAEALPLIIAEQIGLLMAPFPPTLDQLIQVLRMRPMLLVLDNFEQLLPEGAKVVAALVEQAPAIKVMITSRERLRLTAEWSIRLDGLDCAEAAEAVQLFTSAARRINHQFMPPSDGSIEALCRMVLGVPLAIEMAASWVEIQSCTQLMQSISGQILSLRTRQVDVDARHLTLRAVFESSWERLSDTEQAVLSQLAVFEESFTLEAACAIAGTTVETLAFLQDKMLLQKQHNERLSLHELIRQFALEKFALSPDTLRQARRVHADYFADLVAKALPRLKGSESLRRIVNQFNTEMPNISRMWTTLLTEEMLDEFVACWESLFYHFNITARFAEGEAMFREVFTTFGPSLNVAASELGAFARVLCSLLLMRQGRVHEAYQMLFSAEVALIRGREKSFYQIWIDSADSYILCSIGRGEESLQHAHAALDAVKGRVDEITLEPSIYFQLGRSEHLLGNLTSAHAYLAKALQICQQHKITWGSELVLTEMGYVAEANNQFADALRYFEDALAAAEDYTGKWNYVRNQVSIGRLHLMLGDISYAVDAQKGSLRIVMRNPALGLEIDCFTEIALIFKHHGEPQFAAALLDYCATHPECFQPTRDRAARYLEALRVENPTVDYSIARALLPHAKSEISVLLMQKLLGIHSRADYAEAP